MAKTTHARIPIDSLRLARDLTRGGPDDAIPSVLAVAVEVLRAVLVELGDVAADDVAPAMGTAGHGFLDALRGEWDGRDIVQELADARLEAARYRAKLEAVREVVGDVSGAPVRDADASGGAGNPDGRESPE